MWKFFEVNYWFKNRGEKEEMKEIYKSKGLKDETAGNIVEIMSNNTNAFVDVMMVKII